jgi:hypothetical protein
MAAGGVAIDPYLLSGTYPGAAPRNADTKGVTSISPVASGSYHCGIYLGQSLLADYVGNFGDTPYATANALVQMFNVSDGALYPAIDNAIGTNGPLGSVPVRIGDQLRTAGVPRAIVACMAVGGTPISAWAPGGVLNPDIAVMVKRLRAVGLEPTHVCWEQGQAELALGTTRSAYAAYGAGLIGTFRNLGVNCPFMIAKSTYQSGAVNVTIQAAYGDIIAANANTFAGPDNDSITAGRVADLHWTQAQADTVAGMWVTAIQAH